MTFRRHSDLAVERQSGASVWHPVTLLLLGILIVSSFPLYADIAYTPADPSTLTPQSPQWETDYQERLSDMVYANPNWNPGSGNSSEDDGKSTWSRLLAEMWKDRTDNTQLKAWIDDGTAAIAAKGEQLLHSTWSGSFYKPFSCPGYTSYCFRFKNYNASVNLTATSPDQLAKASASIGTLITSANSSTTGQSGWTYMTRPDGYMDRLYNPSEFNSENLNWMARLASVQWAYEKPDLNLGNQSFTGIPIPSTRAWADGYLSNWSRALIGTGRVEWNSNNYWAYTFHPITVLYDLPPGTSDVPDLDPAQEAILANRTRLQARAAADWMVLENALHYLDGFRGGPDSRAKADAHQAFAGSAWPWMYLHFGTDEADPAHPTFSRNAVVSQGNRMGDFIGFIAWTAYRPLQVIVDIAQRKFTLPVEILSAKPHYRFDENNYEHWNGATPWTAGTWAANPTVASMEDYGARYEFETIWMDTNHSLSSAATFRPDASAYISTQSGFFSEQNLWRLLVKGPPGRSVSSLLMTSQGGGYTAAPAVTISAPDLPGGTQATATANLSGGKINNLVITSNGSGYSSPPTVSIAPPAVSQAAGTATVSAGQVQSITVTNGGAGYATPPTVTLSNATMIQATGVAVLGTGANTGKVVSVNLTQPGAGYRNATVTFNNTDTGGSGASGTVTTANGTVVAVNIVNKGSGYTTPPAVIFSAPNPIAATANAIVANGTLTAFGIANKGGGYTSPPTVTVGAPNPSNATASAVLAGGAIQFAGNTNADSDHNGRDPWENIGQFANILIRAVKRPSSNGLWILAPKVATREYSGNHLFCDTGSGVYVAFLPISSGNITLSNSSYDGDHQKYVWTFDDDTLSGLVTEVGTAAQHGNFTAFRNHILADLNTRLISPAPGQIQYSATPQGGNRTAKLQWMKPWTGEPGEPVQTFRDGSVWGNSTTRPAGVVPRFWRNGVEVHYSTWDAYKVVHGEEIVRQTWGGNRLLMMANGTGTEIRVDPITANVTYYAATLTPHTPTVSISTPTPSAAELGPVSGKFRIARDGSVDSPLAVQIAIGGSASTADRTLNPPATTHATIPSGSYQLDIDVTPTADSYAEGTETVTLTLQPDPAYEIGSPSNATITIADLAMDNWRFEFFGPGNPPGSGDTDDPDGDDRSNLLEYALDTHPLQFSTRTPVVETDGGNLTLTYTRPFNRPDLQYRVRLRTDLPGLPTDLPPLPIGSNATHETLRATTPMDAPRKFLELQIQREP